MNSIIVAIVYAILSVIVIIVTKSAANKRIEKKQINTDLDEYKIVPYKVSLGTVLVALVLVAISAGCGYVVSQYVKTVIGNIEIAACYLGTMGAAIIDWKTRTIPNYIPLILICVRIIAFIYEIFFVDDAIGFLLSSIIGCFLCVLMLVFANKMSKGGIGAGDIKLLSSIGFVCGIYVVFPTMTLALISCIIFAVIAVALKKHTWKEHLPFGPYIYIGFAVMCLFKLF